VDAEVGVGVGSRGVGETTILVVGVDDGRIVGLAMGNFVG